MMMMVLILMMMMKKLLIMLKTEIKHAVGLGKEAPISRQ